MQPRSKVPFLNAAPINRYEDGLEVFEFPNKQVERHYPSGRKEIAYADGTRKTVFEDGRELSVFPDGTRVEG